MSDAAAKRGIGDILLAHGFVSEKTLADAAAEQARTAQPLGQILVQRGAITRLELASALAEQWSDPSTSISLLPLPAPGRAPTPQPHDDAQYAARLQDAVADLARRVQSSQPLEGIEERVTDLSLRIEATLARTQHIEAVVATLAESLEGVTGGVEEAVVALQTGTADLGVDLARIDHAVAELASRPVEPPPPDPGLSAGLAELGAVVDALVERPVADEQVRGRIDELVSRLETVVDVAALDDLRSALRDLEARPVGDPELEVRLDRVEALATEGAARADLEDQAAMLADLRATLTELEARPVGSPDLDARLERIEAHAAESLASVADSAAVDALADRVEAAAGVQEGLVASIEALGARIDEIPEPDGRVDGVASRLDGIETKVDTLAAQVELLGAGRADHEVLAAKLDAVETRLALDLVTTDDLSQALDRARDEFTPGVPAPDPRIDEVARELDSVRGELSNITLPPAHDPALVGQLETLSARIEQLAAGGADHESIAAQLEALEMQRASDLDTIDVLARAIDRIRHELSSAPASPPSDAMETDDAVARLVDRLSALETLGTRVDELAETIENVAPAASAQAPDELRQELGLRLDELTHTLDERLAAIGAPASPATGQPAGVEDELERVRMAVERVGVHLGEHDRALAELMRSREVTDRLDELAARIDQIATAGTGGGATGGSGSQAGDVSGDMRALMSRIEEAETSSQADREKLMSRLERLASSIDWRLQRLEVDETE